MEIEKDLLALVEKTSNSLNITSKEFIHEAIGMHLVFQIYPRQQKLIIKTFMNAALKGKS